MVRNYFDKKKGRCRPFTVENIVLARQVAEMAGYHAHNDETGEYVPREFSLDWLWFAHVRADNLVNELYKAVALPVMFTLNPREREMPLEVPLFHRASIYVKPIEPFTLDKEVRKEFPNSRYRFRVHSRNDMKGADRLEKKMFSKIENSLAEFGFPVLRHYSQCDGIGRYG